MTIRILQGDCRDVLRTLPDESVHCAVTSPPYFGLRDYGVRGQIGLEPTPDEYVATLLSVFREAHRVLRADGTLWLNLGDTYASNWPCSRRNVIGSGSLENGKRENRPPRMGDGLKDKDLIGIPWRVAFALQSDGWWLRQDIIWSKPNPMPESVTDRCTKAHEYLFLLSKSERYYYDADAIAEESAAEQVAHNLRYAKEYEAHTANVARGSSQPGNVGSVGIHARAREDGKRNKRSVWTVGTRPFPEAHFATFPPDLIEPCILAGCPEGGMVLDPFGGAGTTGLVADRLKRNAILIELNPDYADMARNRIADDCPMFSEVA